MWLLWEVCCELVARHVGWLCAGYYSDDFVAGVEWVEPARSVYLFVGWLFDYVEGDG